MFTHITAGNPLYCGRLKKGMINCVEFRRLWVFFTLRCLYGWKQLWWAFIKRVWRRQRKKKVIPQAAVVVKLSFTNLVALIIKKKKSQRMKSSSQTKLRKCTFLKSLLSLWFGLYNSNSCFGRCLPCFGTNGKLLTKKSNIYGLLLITHKAFKG